MRYIFKSFALLSLPGALGFIPQYYPDSTGWINAVGTELIQNKELESVRTGKQEASDVWKTLGGPEMAQLCQRENTPIRALVGTLFLAGDLAAVSQSFPTAIAKDLIPVCGLVTHVHALLVRAASVSLYELRFARRDMQARLTMENVTQYTPLANLHLVCGSRMSAIPSIAQVLVKSAAQRDLGTFRSNTVLPPLGAFFKHTPYIQAMYAIHDNSREQLIAGAAESVHLETYFEQMFKTVDENGLFDQNKDVYFLTPVDLDDNNQVGMQKYYMAGRALGLSVLYGFPTGRQLDPNLLDLLCNYGGNDEVLLEFRLLQSGFREMVAPRLLNELKVDSSTVGGMLRGLPKFMLSTRMLQAHLDLSLNRVEQAALFNALNQSPKYPQLLVQLATGLRNIPVGGVASIVPPIGVRVGSTVSVNLEDHTVTFAPGNLGNQFIAALKPLT